MLTFEFLARRARVLPLVLGVALSVSAPTPSAAHAAVGTTGPAEQATPPPRALRNTSVKALGWEMGVSAAAVVALSLVAGEPASRCGWCESNAFDRSVRSALVVENSAAAGVFSHGLTFGLAPIMAFSLTYWPAHRAGYRRYGAEDAAIILSSVAWTGAFTLLAKKTFDRQRPGYHFGRADETEFGAGSTEENLSFFSGDTSLTFAFLASASTLAFMRGYPSAKFLVSVGGAVAVVAGMLRIMADVHWATDVLAGAAVGTAVGVGLPLLVHRPVVNETVRLSPLPLRGGAGLALNVAM